MTELTAPRTGAVLLTAERAALALGIWQFLDIALGVELYRRLWVLSLVPTLALLIVTAALAIRFAIEAISNREMRVAHRWRTALAVPVVSLLVQGLSSAPLALPQTLAARVYFASHGAEWARAASTASPDGVYSLEYSHGVPDGSAHFVHVPRGRPEDLPIKRQLAIAGESLASCRKLSDEWLCWFD